MQKHSDQEKAWEDFVAHEIALLSPVLKAHKYTLEKKQPHIQGERFLMQAVTTTSGKKVILFGKDAHKKRVVIKATTDRNGIREIEHERMLRKKLHALPFAYESFHSPREILHVRNGSQIINIQEFIEQSSAFIDRPQKEQFTYALRAFKTQESVRATTSSHTRFIRNIFETKNAKDYLNGFNFFIQNITSHSDTSATKQLLNDVGVYLSNAQEDIERYCGFLTHTDFVPHNFRIRDNRIYLLDYSSLRFGNKHEGWARFINFMTLYNTELEQALLTYLEQNRAPEEASSLHLMRLYRLGEIIWYYTNVSEKSTGDLRTLNEARGQFWTNVMHHVYQKERVPMAVLTEYRKLRDSLRSKEEKERQKGLH